MIRRYTFPALAIAGVIVAVCSVLYGNQPALTAPPLMEPARAPCASYLAGGGVVEASTENIEVGTPVSRIVTAINEWGDHVNAGDALRLDALAYYRRRLSLGSPTWHLRKN